MEKYRKRRDVAAFAIVSAALLEQKEESKRRKQRGNGQNGYFNGKKRDYIII